MRPGAARKDQEGREKFVLPRPTAPCPSCCHHPRGRRDNGPERKPSPKSTRGPVRGERLQGGRPYGPQTPVSTGSARGELRGNGTEPNRGSAS